MSGIDNEGSAGSAEPRRTREDEVIDKATEKIVLSEGFPIPDNSIPVRSIEVVVYLDENGDENAGVRWQGSNNLLVELGMLEYAKLIIAEERQSG
jgi:hypothetical protein